MRIGANPAKAGLPAYVPQELGVALITYIPLLEGYFKNSLEILTYQLQSLRASTTVPFDLLIFDNGSCPEAVAQLKTWQAEQKIDWLVLSKHNLGKAGAWNWIFAAMPNELICYADSDVLFRPGWLEASQAILQAFPQAGMVAAQPNFYDVLEGQGQAQQVLKDQAGYEWREYWPDKAVIDEFCLGIAASPEVAAPFYQKPLPVVVRLSAVHDGNQAVVGASHMQFIIPRAVARQVTPLPATRGLLRTETMALDNRVDQLGFLHLSTTQPYVFHMGNTLNERLLVEVRKVIKQDLAPRAITPTDQPVNRSWLYRGLSWLASQPRCKPRLMRVYNLLFQVLYTERK